MSKFIKEKFESYSHFKTKKIDQDGSIDSPTWSIKDFSSPNDSPKKSTELIVKVIEP